MPSAAPAPDRQKPPIGPDDRQAPRIARGVGRALGMVPWLAALGAGVALLATGWSPLAATVTVAGLLLAVGTALVRHPRFADSALAAFVVVVLLPALLLLALGVRISSRGPVLVRHPSADPDAPAETLHFRTTAHRRGTSADSRPTAVGRVLHRLNLDELPRLLDAARGQTPFLRAGPR